MFSVQQFSAGLVCALNCSNVYVDVYYLTDTQPRLTGALRAVRLIGSTLATEGRLEVNYDGIWGTVCDDLFDDVDASVACYMLGFRYAHARFAADSLNKCKRCYHQNFWGYSKYHSVTAMLFDLIEAPPPFILGLLCTTFGIRIYNKHRSLSISNYFDY